jgi:hypothetical protein
MLNMSHVDIAAAVRVFRDMRARTEPMRLWQVGEVEGGDPGGDVGPLGQLADAVVAAVAGAVTSSRCASE